MNYLIFSQNNALPGSELPYTMGLSKPEVLDHLNNVLKIQEGQTCKAILLDKGPCQATCLEINQSNMVFQLSKFEEAEARTFDLIIGLSRPQAIKKILEYAAGQPVRKILFYTAELSEKSYSTSKVFEEEQLNKLLTAGLSQCGRFKSLPEISVLTYFPKELVKEYQHKYVLSLESQQKTSSVTFSGLTPLFAIGPERGFTDRELEQFKELQFQDILLSKSILRVETAVIALCAQLEMLEN